MKCMWLNLVWIWDTVRSNWTNQGAAQRSVPPLCPPMSHPGRLPWHQRQDVPISTTTTASTAARLSGHINGEAECVCVFLYNLCCGGSTSLHSGHFNLKTWFRFHLRSISGYFIHFFSSQWENAKSEQLLCIKTHQKQCFCEQLNTL